MLKSAAERVRAGLRLCEGVLGRWKGKEDGKESTSSGEGGVSTSGSLANASMEGGA
jgi:hypothetical protein